VSVSPASGSTPVTVPTTVPSALFSGVMDKVPLIAVGVSFTFDKLTV